MPDHLLDHLKRYGDDLGTCQAGLHDMKRIAYAGYDDLGLEVVVPEDLSDLPDEIHAVMAGIIQAADKRAQE